MNKSIFVGIAVGVFLTGCGSSSNDKENGFGVEYQGETDAYVLTDESSLSVAASSEYAILALASPKASLTLSNRAQIASSNAEEIMTTISQVLEQEAGSESIPDTDVAGDCGGSLSLSGNYENFSFSASNFCITIDSYEVVIAGAATFTANQSGLAISYDNFKITSEDPSVGTIAIDGEVTITSNQTSFGFSMNVDMETNGVKDFIAYEYNCDESFSCTFNTTFEGQDRKIYKVESVIVESTGTYIMEIYLPDFGKLEVETESLTFCEDGSIESGQILLYDQEDHVLDISYTQCGVEPTVEFGSLSIVQ